MEFGILMAQNVFTQCAVTHLENLLPFSPDTYLQVVKGQPVKDAPGIFLEFIWSLLGFTLHLLII